MRHIALPSFDAPPCNGEIRYSEIASPPTDATAHRSLPILGQSSHGEAPPRGLWTCARCGQIWTREPLPQDAL
jgi:hypothetical protein